MSSPILTTASLPSFRRERSSAIDRPPALPGRVPAERAIKRQSGNFQSAHSGRIHPVLTQVAITLVREMPVLAAARIIGITDQRLWRIVEHYVGKAVERLDLTRVKAIGLDETTAKRGQTYVTVFIDPQAQAGGLRHSGPRQGNRHPIQDLPRRARRLAEPHRRGRLRHERRLPRRV